MNLNIRPETAADVAAIEGVTTGAFVNAPHTSHTEQFIISALRRAGQLSISLVAEADGRVIGHVAVSAVSISDGSGGWVGLGAISVLPELRRRGVASRLMHDALRILRERGAAGCVVLGEPGYYSRFGFLADAGLVLADVPPEFFQALSLDASRPHGTVSYREAFNVEQGDGRSEQP